MNVFAENLKTFRKLKNLTQTDLTEKLFTSPQTISRWETGDGEPSLDMLASLADILEVSADRLVIGKSLPEREIFDGIERYISEMPRENAANDGFQLFRRVLNGFRGRYFLEHTGGEHPTYSTLHAGNLRGIYADRDDTPHLFVMFDGSREENEAETIAEANLWEIFATLSNDMVIRAFLKLNDIPLDRSYDAQSLATVLGIPEADILRIAEALKTLGHLTESVIPYNEESVTVYKRAGKYDVMLLLSLTRLLFCCPTDGNM